MTTLDATKKCWSCHLEKPISQFHLDAGKHDGHRSVCSSCSCAIAREWNHSHRPRRRVTRKRYVSSPSGRETVKRLAKKYALLHRERYNANYRLRKAVRSGRIVKPTNCQCCGMPTPKPALHGHHPDYSKPLDVVWLCCACHVEVHSRKSA